MRTKKIMAALVGGLFSVGAIACPDFGIGIEGLPADAKIRVTGGEITVTAPSGKRFYTFYFDSKSGAQGQWCYSQSGAVSKNDEKVVCGDFEAGSEIVLSEGGVDYAKVRSRVNGFALAATKEKGASLAILALDTGGGYRQPWLRFVYTSKTDPKGEAFSRREKWEAELTKKKTDPKIYAKYTLHHRMYVDLFANYEQGETLDGPKVLGSAIIEKTEQPFLVPRELAKTTEADLDGSHWKTVVDGDGCMSKVEEVKK